MTRDDIRNIVLQVLTDIAPEVDPQQVLPGVDLREQLDIDSMDFQNFVIGIHEQLQVDIPERDYPKCNTLDGCVNYLAPRLHV
jgi:acyl carrier protein